MNRTLRESLVLDFRCETVKVGQVRDKVTAADATSDGQRLSKCFLVLGCNSSSYKAFSVFASIRHLVFPVKRNNGVFWAQTFRVSRGTCRPSTRRRRRSSKIQRVPEQRRSCFRHDPQTSRRRFPWRPGPVRGGSRGWEEEGPQFLGRWGTVEVMVPAEVRGRDCVGVGRGQRVAGQSWVGG